MKDNKRLITCIVEVLLGATLTICGMAGVIDSYWSGMGTALVIVGALQLIRQIRYRTDETYKAAVDVQVQDERNKYLSLKAWAWAGYLLVMIGAVASIVLKLLHQDMLSTLAGGCVCLIMVLYWLSYLVLCKKY